MNPEADRTAWLEARRSGIGGSEAAIIMGVNPWQSPYSLYQDKIGAAVDDRASPAMYWGTKLEPVVRDAYCEIVGRDVKDGAVMARHSDASLEFMLANTDGEISPVKEHDGAGVYEGKTTGIFTSKAWDDGVPLYYQIQVQHYLAVLGLSWGSVAVFIMGERDPFHWVDVERNDGFIAAMCDKEHAFWRDHVVPRVAPPVDGSSSTTTALKMLHPRDNGRVIFLPPAAQGWLEMRAQVSKEIKVLEETRDEMTNLARAALGGASYGIVEATGGGVSYKSQASRLSAAGVLDSVEAIAGKDVRVAVTVDVDAKRGDFRVLRVASPKTLAKMLKEQERTKTDGE